MSNLAQAILLAAVVAGASPALGQAESAGEDPWAPLRTLEGRWQGEGQGFGQTSEVRHEWRFVVDGHFLRLETRSAPESGGGEVHEDVGYVSWSADDSTLRFRQFLSEGFVNTFRIDVTDGETPTLTFEPLASEGAGGMLARMTLTFLNDDSYEMVLALGREGTEFKPCQTMRLQRAE